MVAPLEYLTLKDITAPAEATPSFGLKDILSSIKDINDLIKNVQGLFSTMQGARDGTPTPQFRGEPNNTPIHPTRVAAPVAELDYADLVDKAIGMLELVKNTQGDVPVSVVIAAIKELRGDKPNGIEDNKQVDTDLRSQGERKDGVVETSTETTTETSGSRPIGGIQHEAVQSISPRLGVEPEMPSSSRGGNGNPDKPGSETPVEIR